jgi:hypothetical protein
LSTYSNLFRAGLREAQCRARRHSRSAADAVTYNAVTGGGAGGHTIAWSNGATGATATIDPADGTFCVDTSLTATVTANVAP